MGDSITQLTWTQGKLQGVGGRQGSNLFRLAETKEPNNQMHFVNLDSILG